MLNSDWYALRTKPRKENSLHQQLLSRNIECFFPRATVKPVNPRSTKFRPYFPGYLFVNVDIKERGTSEFQWMPYSLGLVGYDGEPASIPDALIFSLKQRLAQLRENGDFEFDQLVSGTKLRIIDGPFRGYQAIFDTRLSGNERVRVLLQLIDNRQMPIEMQVGQISKKT